MKHIRKISAAAILAFLLCSVSIAAFAHSGGTDSDGGHYDRSTGEYHWHHGEDDHQHWDIDNDGDLDCPLYFRNWEKRSKNEEETHPIPEETIPTLPALEPLQSFPTVNSSYRSQHSTTTTDSPSIPFLICLGVFALLSVAIHYVKKL